MVKETNKRKDYRRRPDAALENVPALIDVWKPVTKLGQMVKDSEITDIDQIFNQNLKILEAEVVDVLLPGIGEELLLIGQAKGKFGGGQRRIFRQTQKKTKEGNRIHFMTYAVVGNKNGYVGVGTGKSKETVPARDKSKRKAKLNLMRVRRGCGSWQCGCKEPHSIPFTTTGKLGSVEITLMPAPKGKGLCVEKECAKILELAGIKDVWSKTKGQTKTKVNLIAALMDALKNLSTIKYQATDVEKFGIVEGKMKETKEEKSEDTKVEDTKVEEPKVEDTKVEKTKEEPAKEEAPVKEPKEETKETKGAEE
jgi:small subunit ribosomal protein S5